MKRIVALIVAVLVTVSLCACGQTRLAKEADAAIDAIGEVTYMSLEAIQNAEKIISVLTPEEIATVNGRLKLVEARELYEEALMEEIVAIGDEALDTLDFTGAAAKMKKLEEYCEPKTVSVIESCLAELGADCYTGTFLLRLECVASFRQGSIWDYTIIEDGLTEAAYDFTFGSKYYDKANINDGLAQYYEYLDKAYKEIDKADDRAQYIGSDGSVVNITSIDGVVTVRVEYHN